MTSNTDANLSSNATDTMGGKQLLGNVLTNVSNLCIRMSDLDSRHRKIRLSLKNQEVLMTLETLSLDPVLSLSNRSLSDAVWNLIIAFTSPC